MQLPIANSSLLLQTNLRLYVGERLAPIGALDFPRKDITQRLDLDNKALGLRYKQTKHPELCGDPPVAPEKALAPHIREPTLLWSQPSPPTS